MMNERANETKELVSAAVAAAEEKKAFDFRVLEIPKELALTDYFMICSAGGDRQAKAIAEEVRVALRDLGRKPLRVAGEDVGKWILMDYGDIIVHIFTEETREYYQLERLWRDAPQVEIG